MGLYECYYWSCSHCLSFDKAMARWDSVFFFTLSISAYVSPSYSKIGSQPAPVSLSRSETDVPSKAHIPKLVGPRAGTIFPFARFSGASSQSQRAAHSDSSLENDRLMARSSAVGKGADGLGAFVFVCHEEVVQTLVAKRLKEPFALRKGLINHLWSCRK